MGGPGFRGHAASLFGTDVLGLSTGGFLTPDAAPGSRLFSLDPHLPGAAEFRAGGAVTSVLSPDASTLLVLTSGYNKIQDADGRYVPSGSNEYVFVYDVRGGAPRETGVVPVPNTFVGLAFHPGGQRFFVSGGADDVVREFARDPGGRWAETLPAMPLGHLDAAGYGGLGISESPFTEGLAVSASGKWLVVANNENDSVSVLDLDRRAPVAEISLLPGGGVAGGEFPAGVALVGEDRAYVTSLRDREVVELDLGGAKVLRRIHVGGQPTKIIANRAGTRLFVANANSDSVSLVDRLAGTVVGEISTVSPRCADHAAEPTCGPSALRGSNPNALALSPDEKTLYVTNGGNNTLAVIALDAASGGKVLGLIPTGFYPSAVSVSGDGAWLFVAHTKSVAGPNPGGPWSVPSIAMKEGSPGRSNAFSLQLNHGGLLALPVPDAATLAKLTAQSLLNNRFTNAAGVPPVFASLRGAVKHVIYVIGENRTFDQILGDVKGADGDPSLVHWGEALTPNQHALARRFVTLDRFFDSGSVSGDGWQWTMGGRSTDVAEKAVPLEYASRGHHTYDWEGMNRQMNMGMSSWAERVAADPRAPDILPGAVDVAAIDGPAEGGRGFLWDAVMAAGMTVRDYGVFIDDTRYSLLPSDPARIGPVAMPFATKTRVAYAARASLRDAVDPYFRGFDMTFADFWRYQEWAREFDGYVARGDLPALQIMKLSHDHMGSFETALDGVNTPDTQQADHDYALGLLVEKVSKSPYWRDTIIIKIEDDAQNGSDHVDAHRSLALFAGGHVRRGAVVSTPYTTPSVLRTIELLLGVPPLGQADAFANAMGDVLTVEIDAAPFEALVPPVLRSTKLPLPPGPMTTPRGDAHSWGLATQGFDFRHEDRVPSAEFNRVLFCGLVDGRRCATDPFSRRGAVEGHEGSDDD